LTPGMLADLFARLAAQAADRSRLALEPLAIAIETQAKINASTGSHRYGTRTPARPGAGPAIISGALRRSITHTPIAPTAGGWSLAVGMAAGVYAQTPVSKYAEYLETGLRTGERFPFLAPAFRFGVGVAAPSIYAAVFGAPWG